jgi:purine nucleoside phosphorylase
MRVGVLTGTGTYALPGAGEGRLENVITVYGDVPVTRFEAGGVEVLHVSRHGPGHKRLSNHVTHRANITALGQLGADAIAAVTVCGAVDPACPLGP